MMRSLKKLLLFFICLSAHHFTYAQVTDTLSYELDTLRVEAVRSAVSSTEAPLSLSIKSRSLQESITEASSSLESIAGDLPGIWINNRQNAALGESVTIRGVGWRAAFGVRGIQMVLDGIPLTTADGQSITNIIDPAFIKRVELIRGPASSYWGNSSGGVLYLSTKPRRESRDNLYLRTYGGSYQNKKIDVQLTQNFGKNNVQAYTSYQSDDGYRNYSASQMLRSGVNGNYQLKNQGNISYMGALLYMPKAQHPSGLTADQVDADPRQATDSFVNADAGKQVTQGQIGLNYDQPTSAGLFNITGYGTYRDLTNPLPFGIITVDRLAGGMRSSFDFTVSNKLNIRSGAEIKYQHDDREEFENNDGTRGATTVNQLEKVTNKALFATADYAIADFSILGSLRYDHITFSTDSVASDQSSKRSFQALSPSIGVSYNPGPTTIFANLSTSFEAPTTTELVNRPDGGNGFNPNLKPEHTTGLELGSRGTIANQLFEYDLTIYRLWIQDLLFPYQLEANGPTFYRNQGETRHQGIEIAGSLHPTRNLSFSTTYTLTDAKFIEAQTVDNIELADNKVPGVAKHRLSSTLSFSPGNWQLQTNGQFVSSYPVNNINTATNDNYTRFDIKASYQYRFNNTSTTITPFVNINNIFDIQYNGSAVVNAFGGRFYEPAPGRNWKAGIAVNF